MFLVVGVGNDEAAMVVVVVFVLTGLALICQSDVPRGRVGSNEAAMVVVVVFVLTDLALSCQSDVPCSRR